MVVLGGSRHSLQAELVVGEKTLSGLRRGTPRRKKRTWIFLRGTKGLSTGRNVESDSTREGSARRTQRALKDRCYYNGLSLGGRGSPKK